MTETRQNLQIISWLYLMPTVAGYHNGDSRLATLAGWPDWVFIGKKIIFREIKSSNDTLSVDQRRVGKAIMQAGGDSGRLVAQGYPAWRPGSERTGGNRVKRMTQHMREHITILAEYMRARPNREIQVNHLKNPLRSDAAHVAHVFNRAVEQHPQLQRTRMGYYRWRQDEPVPDTFTIVESVAPDRADILTIADVILVIQDLTAALRAIHRDGVVFK